MATINGTEGDDIDGNALVGTPGDDIYLARGGRDYLLPTLGNDVLNGGDGDDVAIYDWAGFFTNGVFINNTDTAIGTVLARTVDKRGFGTDTLIGVENFHGTNFNDIIYVGTSPNGTYSFDRDGDDIVVASQDPANPNGHSFLAGRGNDSYTGTLTRFDNLDYFGNSLDPPTQGLNLTMTGGGAGTATDPWGFTDSFTGIERVIGTNLADTIIMDDGDRNVVVGGAGNDILNGGAGARDVLDYREEAGRLGGFQGVTVDLAAGTATDTFGDTDTISGFERVTGTQFADTLRGDGQANTLLGEEGDDVLEGRGGDDYFEPLQGNDTVDGGDGFDRVSYEFDADTGGTAGVTVDLALGTATDGFGDTDTLIGIENVTGTQADDILLGDDEDNQLEGRGGDDLIEGNDGDDSLDGGAGNDTLIGGKGGDFFRPGTGNDVIDGGSNGANGEEDTLTYLEGNGAGITVHFVGETEGTVIDYAGDTDTFSGIERIRGTLQNDVMTGAEGGQTFQGHAGNDTFDGGAGDDDQLDYSRDRADIGAFQGVTVDMAAGTAIDGWGDTDTFVNIERIRGTVFADTMTGAAGRQSLRGEGGNDVLDGGADDDDLSGGAGDDILIGGEGGDFLQPGAGTDTIDGGANGATGSQDELSYGFDEDATTGITVTFTSETDGTVIDYAGDTDTFTGIEIVRGTMFDDVMTGAEGRQTFKGLQGNDTFHGGAGGDDQLDYSRDRADLGAFQGITVDMAAGTAIDGWGDTDTFTGIERIRGSEFDDTITGDDADNELYGEAGDDVLDGGLGQNYLRGDEGNDTITSRSRRDFIEAGNGNDTVIVMLGDDEDRPGVDPGLGSDTIVQMAGAEITLTYASLDQGVTIDLALGTTQKPFGDTDSFGIVHEVEGSRGDDKILGSDRDYEAFRAGAGNDTVDGRGGFDELRFTNRFETGVTVDMAAGTATGSLGTVSFTGIEAIQGSRTGADSVTGSDAPFEQFRMLGGNDLIDGGGGIDQVSYTSDRFFGGTAGVTVNLAAGFAIDGFGDTDTLLNIEQARGTIFDDLLIGDDGDNRLSGDGGNDIVRGGGGVDVVVGNDGDDTLFGGDDRDFLNGGAGIDVMHGEAGPDVFRGTAAALAGDTIADYEAGDAIWVVGGDGGDGAPSVGANITTDGALFYIDTDGDGTAEFTMVNGNGYLGPVASFGGPAGGGGAEAAVVSLDGAGGVAAQALEGDAGATAIALTLRRTGDLNATVTVDFAVAGAGAAPAGADDLASGFGAGSLTFLPGATLRTVTLGIAGDTAIEPDELLKVTLTGVSGDGLLPAALGGAEAFVRIVNDDARPQVAVQGGKFAEDAGPLIFTVTRDGPDLGAELTVSYLIEGAEGLRGATADDVAGGLPQSGVVTFAPGEDTATVSLGIVADSLPELHERVVIRLTGLSGPAAPDFDIGAGVAVAEIRNDDSGIPPLFLGSGLDTGSFLDPHLVTRDGLAYEFQAVGEFVLVEAVAGTPLTVQVRYGAVPGSDIASQTTAVATALDGVRVVIDLGAPSLLRVDGVAVDPASLAGGLDVGDGRLFYDGEAVTVVYATGEQMRVDVFDGFLNVALALDPGRPTRGLLGDGDGATGNDLALPDGTVLAQPVAHGDLYGVYADAWRITDATSLFDYAPGQGTADFTDTAFPRAVLDLGEVPAALLAQAEALAAGIADPVLRDAAIRDFLMSGNDAFFAAAETVEAVPVAELAPTGAPLAAGVGASAADLTVIEGDEGATTLVFTLWRTGSTAETLDLGYAIAGAAGTLAAGTATFAAGSDTVAVTVDVPGDRVPEPDEAIVLTLDAVPAGLLRFSGRAEVTVVDDDNAPVAGDDAAGTAFGTPLVLTAAQLVANDTDADGDPLSVVAVAPGTGGTVVLDGGTVTFTPDAGFSGDASFGYTVADGQGGTDTATVTVTVGAPVNAPPIAEDDSATTTPGVAVTIDVLANDTDPEGDPLEIAGVSDVTGGTAEIDGDAFVFTPAAGFTGTGGFDYTISDGAGGTDTARVSVEVTAPLPVLLLGTAGNDRLTGTEADEIIDSLGGRIDVMAGGGGADIFRFSATANGARDTRTVLDFGPDDLLDFGTAAVAATRQLGADLYLYLDQDRDVVILRGVSGFDADWIV